MEETNSTHEKQRFVGVPSKMSMAILKIIGTFYQSPINIAICPANKENFINVDIANQLPVQESNIEKNERNEEKIKKNRLTDR